MPPCYPKSARGRGQPADWVRGEHERQAILVQAASVRPGLEPNELGGMGGDKRLGVAASGAPRDRGALGCPTARLYEGPLRHHRSVYRAGVADRGAARVSREINLTPPSPRC